MNNGPIHNLHVELAFDDGRPIPHVIVGRNGSGKTNLLSIIADALLQGASKAFTDVLTQEGPSHHYFRILGTRTVTSGETIGLSVLRFSDGEDEYYYHEKVGELSALNAKALLPESLQAGASWSADTSSKDLRIGKEKSESIFESGIYTYFPSSRSEQPHWFNKESIESDSFDITEYFKETLGRPLFVEHGLDELAQWLMGVMTESRLKVDTAEFAPGGNDKVILELETAEYMPTQEPLLWANGILKTILDDADAHFYWAGRRSARKIGIETTGKQLITGLNSLSGGQATLLALFGTLLRYGDATGRGSADWQGIVVIDELDAHMHVDLQLKALPKLISQFPTIQFIVSSHSPFFALGMEKQFTPTGVRVLELPNGTPVNAEAYEEFQRALDAFRDTKQFARELENAMTSGDSPIVFVGGETDLKYYQTAARVLGYSDLIAMFEWIGQTDEKSGGGRFTGDKSLEQTVSFLRANPKRAAARKIVILYDCDVNKSDETFDNVHVLAVPAVPNALCRKGTENLLPESVFTDDMYDRKEVPGPYGRNNTIYDIRKMRLCDSLCGADADAATFENFRSILERIDGIMSEGTVQGGNGQPS